MPGPGEAPTRRSGYRLCIVSDAQEFGGAERFLANLVTELPGDVDLTLLATSPVVLARVAGIRPGVRVELVEDTVGGFRRALIGAAADVVHLNLIAFPSCRSAVLAALSLRLPVVLVDHLPTAGLSWRGRLLQRLMTRACAARVALGEGARREVSEFGGVPLRHILSIPNGVPAIASAGPRARAPRPVLGVLGRLEQQKGVDLLLETLTALPDVELDVAGDGSERQRLQRLATELGVDPRVRFRGWVADVPSFLREIDVLVLPSRQEAMPLTVLEAMHAGVPVVATAVGSVPEVVVDGVTGFVVPAEDVAALTTACRALVDDPELRSELGRHGRSRAAQLYSDAAMASAYDHLYRSVLRRRR